MDDLFDEFMEYDFTMGSDVVKCPHCGADVPCSLFFDDEVECPKCGKKFRKDGNNG
jgi:endogenous inhibitor of DNA gyrase (YacG/DUF329 family)